MVRSKIMDVASHFDDELPARPSSLHALRRRFRRWLEPAVPGRVARNDIVLTMSELAAVTLREHEGEDLGRLHARAWIDGDGIVIEVVDGRGDVLDARARQLDSAAPGLAVVASLVDVLSVRAAGGATQIRARMDLASRSQ
jgi:anti-sigma regulatory factor (Ser/Thr protein kinase)